MICGTVTQKKTVQLRRKTKWKNWGSIDGIRSTSLLRSERNKRLALWTQACTQTSATFTPNQSGTNSCTLDTTYLDITRIDIGWGSISSFFFFFNCLVTVPSFYLPISRLPRRRNHPLVPSRTESARPRRRQCPSARRSTATRCPPGRASASPSRPD